MIIAMPSAPKAQAFQAFQRRFLTHIRNPRQTGRPAGVNARRMGVYNELLFNNIEDVLAGCFPVIKRILGRTRWIKLVREFFAEHRSKRPFFRQVPDEFIDYLKKERKRHRADPPFLKDLAHYEWIELDLFVSNAEERTAGLDPQGDLLKGRPILNPVMQLASYSFEVHRISPHFQPKKASRTPFRYLVFRDPSDEIQFIVLNAVTARLIELLQEGKLSGEKILKKIAGELRASPYEGVMSGGAQILEDLRKKGAILGVRQRA